MSTSKVTTSQIEYVVLKRQKNFDYIRRVHEGRVHWLNVVLITQEDITKIHDPNVLAKRAEQWFYLGVSLAKILDLPNGAYTVRAFSQLLEEYEYHFANTALHGFKFMMTKAQAPPTFHDASSTDPVKPIIYRSGKTAVYEYLTTPNVPFRLDYFQVVFSLCDMLSLVYTKFMDATCAVPSISEAIIKIDAKVKHNLVSILSREITSLALSILKQQFGQMHSMFAASGMSEEEFLTLFSDDLNANVAETLTDREAFQVGAGKLSMVDDDEDV
eukprot:GILK01004835.1.p1 GENE.GILK01004835.1~~GILK01004835.1.p1  ORF type:complete len:272 (-),score=32.19 GILK01004835.1:127-942(-)